jgi:hypothetical protein
MWDKAFKNNHPNQSAAADHMLIKDRKKQGYKHKFDIQNLELLRPVNKHRRLDFYKSYQFQHDSFFLFGSYV